MAGVYTQRLCSVYTGPAGQQNLLFTVAQNEIVVVRDILITNLQVTDEIVTVYLRPGQGLTVPILRPTVAATSTYHLECRIAMVGGDSLLVTTFQPDDGYTIEMTGYVFLAP